MKVMTVTSRTAFEYELVDGWWTHHNTGASANLGM
jgi:hypothetical protein